MVHRPGREIVPPPSTRVPLGHDLKPGGVTASGNMPYPKVIEGKAILMDTYKLTQKEVNKLILKRDVLLKLLENGYGAGFSGWTKAELEKV